MLKITKLSIGLVFFLANFLFLGFSSFALDCSNCVTGACSCSISECNTGSLDIYTSPCTGIPVKEFVFDNGIFSWAKADASNYYFQAFCDSGVRSNCTYVNLASSVSKETNVTTTSTSTTTTITKTACPNECCVGDPNYYTKFCPTGYYCENNQCVQQFAPSETPTETVTTFNEGGGISNESSGFQLNYSIIGIVAIVIIAGVLIFYFLRKKPAKTQDKWSELYKKYGRPQ